MVPLSRIFLLSILLAAAAFAGDIPIYWTGGTGNWEVASNWSLGVVPDDNGSNIYAVTINSGNVTLDNGVRIDTMTLGSAAALGVDGTNFEVDTGLTLQAGSNLSVGGDSMFLASMNTIAGTLEIGGGSDAALTADGGTLTITSTGQLLISGTETVDISGNVTNAGSIFMSYVLPPDAGSQLTISGTLTNTGVVNVGFNDSMTVGGSSTPDTAQTPTPEPVSWVLTGAGLLGAAAVGWRPKQASR